MLQPSRVALATACLLLVPAALSAGPVVRGQYFEARVPRPAGDLAAEAPSPSARALAPAGTAGSRAVLGWRVEDGRWDGVALDTLAMVLIVDAGGPLGSPFEGRVRATLWFDTRATEAQRSALLGLVAELSPRYADAIVRVRRAAISLRPEGASAGGGAVDDATPASSAAPHDLHVRSPSGEDRLRLRFAPHEHHPDAGTCAGVCGGTGREPETLARHAAGVEAAEARTLPAEDAPALLEDPSRRAPFPARRGRFAL